MNKIVLSTVISIYTNMNTTPLYTDTISSLRECYDTHSEKFSSTRKKHRPELAYVIDQLKTQ